MKYFILAQVALYTLVFSCVHAQNEDWDTYMANYDGKPGSVLVNMALINSAPDSKFPWLLVTGPQVQNCQANGLPGKDEIDQLEEILDATDNFITGVTAKVLTGTLTYNCERVNYYYIKDTIGVRNAIMRMYRHSYPGYQFAINMKRDAEWHTYSTFLYPDEKTKNWMENDKIITGMLQHGDSLTQKRKINFELYFRSDTDRKAFVKFARAKGYDAGQELVSQSQAAPYELIISKFDAVKMDLIQVMTEEIKKEMKKYKGFYNGWSAPLK